MPPHTHDFLAIVTLLLFTNTSKPKKILILHLQGGKNCQTVDFVPSHPYYGEAFDGIWSLESNFTGKFIVYRLVERLLLQSP